MNTPKDHAARGDKSLLPVTSLSQSPRGRDGNCPTRRNAVTNPFYYLALGVTLNMTFPFSGKVLAQGTTLNIEGSLNTQPAKPKEEAPSQGCSVENPKTTPSPKPEESTTARNRKAPITPTVPPSPGNANQSTEKRNEVRTSETIRLYYLRSATAIKAFLTSLISTKGEEARTCTIIETQGEDIISLLSL